MRKVTIHTSQGSQAQEVETDVALWGELQTVLTEQNIKHKKMKAVVGQTRNTLESPQAVLPEGDFILFLMTKKNKSGAIDPKTAGYAELKTAIKEIIAAANDDKKEHEKVKKFFADGSKNYTQTGTDYMRKRLLAWIKKFGTTSIPRKATAKKADTKNKSKKEEQVPATKTVDIIAEISEVVKEFADTVKEEDLTEEGKEQLKGLKDDLIELKAKITEYKTNQKANEEAKKKAKGDMKNLSREFDDVDNIY